MAPLWTINCFPIRSTHMEGSQLMVEMHFSNFIQYAATWRLINCIFFIWIARAFDYYTIPVWTKIWNISVTWIYSIKCQVTGNVPASNSWNSWKAAGDKSKSPSPHPAHLSVTMSDAQKAELLLSDRLIVLLHIGSSLGFQSWFCSATEPQSLLETATIKASLG